MKKYLLKISSIILISGILVSAIPMASAAETNDIQLYAGDKVTYQVAMPESEEDAICAFQIETTYNFSKLQFESLEWNNKLSSFLRVYCNTDWEGIHYVNYCGSTVRDYEFAAGETFATVTYTVKEDMLLSEAEFDNLIVEICYVDEVTNDLYALMNFVKGEGIVDVISSSEKNYDVNGDGKVNISDATLIQKHCAEINVLKPEKLKNADVDGDGRVNVTDATVLQKLLVV